MRETLTNPMRALVVGDHFIPAAAFAAALEVSVPVMVREVTWSGESREAHHVAQQRMEQAGPDAVPTPAEMVDAVADVEVLAVHFAPVPAAVFEAAGELRVVVVARAGVENVDVEAATRHGVAVVNVRGRNASAVAEQTIGLFLAESRDLARADAAVKAGRWRKCFPGTVRELSGSTVGLVGFGQVGRQVARRLAGFDVRLLVYDPYVPGPVIAGYGGEQVDDLDTVFCEADFVSLHARLTEETRRFIGEEQLSKMKPTAYVVNNARSRLVDEDALYEALAHRRIAGAALDVHDHEPLPADSRWRQLDNVTLTPHLAGSSPGTTKRSVALVAEAVDEFIKTGRCERTVNRAALATR